MQFQPGDRVVLNGNRSIVGTVISVAKHDNRPVGKPDEVEVFIDAYRTHLWRFEYEISPITQLAPEECNCGFGGFHDDINIRCILNQ